MVSLFSGNTKNDSKLGALIFGIPGLIGVSEDWSFVQHSAFSSWLNFKGGVISEGIFNLVPPSKNEPNLYPSLCSLGWKVGEQGFCSFFLNGNKLEVSPEITLEQIELLFLNGE